MLSSRSKKKTMKSSKTMRRIQRGEVMVAPEIPLDLLIEIVKRLPIKSLARFKCVSKLWCSLISSQGYVFASPPRLYISSRVNHNYVEYELLSFSLASTSKSSTVFDLDLTKQGIGGYHIVALRGLILYIVYKRACIYNPTTGQKVTLPVPAIDLNILVEEEGMSDHDYFLGYDPVLDQYKVVCAVVVWSEKLEIFEAQHWWVFVLEAGSFWKKIDCDHPRQCPRRQRLCINGVIYYLAFSYMSVVKFISFDVRSEEFSMIQLPHAMLENVMSVGLIEYGGKPTLFDYTNLKDSLVNLWVLEDSGIWSRKSLVLQLCQMHFFPDNFSFYVIGTTQNGEVVLKPYKISYPYYILYYDLHKNDVKRVDIRGISKEPFYLALMDTGESIMHLKI